MTILITLVDLGVCCRFIAIIEIRMPKIYQK